MLRYAFSDEVLRVLIRARMFDLKGVSIRFESVAELRASSELWRGGVLRELRGWGTRSSRTLMTKYGRGLAKAIIEYEKDNPRFSAHEGPSALLYGNTLFTWSHSAAVREIENVRRVRQRDEERKAKRSGRTGCAKTRCRAEPRPLVAICVDDCRHK